MTGAAATEAQRRTLRQLVGEGLYRFAGNKLYVGGRYNTVNGQLAGIANDITVKRYAGRRRLVRHPERALEDRVREPEVQRLPDERHPQRRQVQGLHGRGRRRLLTLTLAPPHVRGRRHDPHLQCNRPPSRDGGAVQEGPVLLATKPFTGLDAPLAVARWLAAREERELHVVSVLEHDDTVAATAGVPSAPSDAMTTSGERWPRRSHERSLHTTDAASRRLWRS